MSTGDCAARTPVADDGEPAAQRPLLESLQVSGPEQWLSRRLTSQSHSDVLGLPRDVHEEGREDRNQR